MKRYWLSALAVGVGLAIGVACGPKANDDDLCASEGGFCTTVSACGNVLPFACGEGYVCCQPGAATPTPNPTSTSTTSTPDAGTTTTKTTPDAGSESTVDSAAPEKDSAAPTETDAGKDSSVEDSGSKDAAKD